MPGPCSAPNGNWSLTVMKRDKAQIVKSGKTDKKRGTNFDKVRDNSQGHSPKRVQKERNQARRAEREDA